MNHGKLLKKLRTSRGITQKQLAEGISSQAALSRMEQSGNIPSYLLLSFLDRLDIHPVEFFTLAAENQVLESQSFLNKMNETCYNKEKMNELVNEEITLYKQTGLKKHKINSMRVKAIYHKIHDLPLENSKEIAKEITKYLLKFDSWFLNDISLYSDLLFIFSNDFIKAHHKTVLNSLETLPLGGNQKHIYIVTYTNNTIVLAFERKNLTDLDFYLNSYKDFLNDNPAFLTDRIYYSIYCQLQKLMIKFNNEGYNKLISDLKIFKKYNLDDAYQNMLGFINSCLDR
ncbi:helix-turn-helix domain-containing protein [Xylocopilactobacillus apis]|uniref:Rgg/GadR/MutR family transcriptional activator n=1 Tax=Xylocopilactobacillus apis TaxID=2932183 RepID=A0AAU9D017_9LACO|nr:Rgg/GadR/MutR family transcriptional regulator [Xylocopilactobacillus apis]BDR55610.1 Rgg/GadR/MutR family transcriptional activator [Xylocopilactobacillus apis]